jgi:hypothetical protein
MLSSSRNNKRAELEIMTFLLEQPLTLVAVEL